MLDGYLQYLFEYDSWANRVVLEFMAANPALGDATAPGVFGTAGETMNHLLGAEGSYLNRLANGPSYTNPPPMTVEEMLAFAAELERIGRERLESLPDPNESLQRSLGRFAAKTVFGQLIQHGIELRTQVGTIAGAAGTEPPDLTSWRFGGKV